MATKETPTKESESRRKLAFIVGIENYENCPPLGNPVNDANAMTSVLESIGFIVTKLLNPASLDFRNALNKFQNEIEPNDVILFYFSGHGTQWDGQNYLIPKDISGLSVQDLKKKAINAQTALLSLSDMEPFAIIFLLDCCRSYPLITSDENKSRPRTTNTSPLGLQAMQMAGSLIAFACAPGAIANDGDEQSNGLFTKHLLEHITSHDDILTILCNVTSGVRKASKAQQIPYVNVSLGEKVYLVGKVLTPPIKSEPIPNIVRIPDNDLKLDEEIGRGAFGIVYRARWLSQDLDVAVKRLHLTHLDKKAEETFFEEILVLHKLRHPHIINLYGACLDPGKYSVVMKYMSLGSLYQVLHRDKLPLKWSDRLSIALQTTKGTNYLHNLQPPVFHRDIKSLNILLHPSQDGYIVKLCDFGLAKIRNETTQRSLVSQSLPCTLQWTAPEILNMKPYTAKSDVYSLGVVFWEIATNEIPYGQSKPDIICAFVLRGARLEIPETTQPSFSSLIEKCWAHDPKDRPTCSRIIRAIQCCADTRDTASEKDNTTKLDEEKISSSMDIQNSASVSTTSIQKEVSLTPLLGEKMENMNIESSSVRPAIPILSFNTQWEQRGVSVAGGNGAGGNNSQLDFPFGLFVDDDDDQTIVIADHYNHRIMQWKRGDTQGQVVAGGNDKGNRLDQLNHPTDVLIDKELNSLIIADWINRRVVRWSRRSGTAQGEILIDNIRCYGLAMDEHRNLYVSDDEKHEVRRYKIDRGDKKGTVVAGGNGTGSGLSQISFPTYLFVDRNQSLYVSDFSNHRVMKWDKGAAQGLVVVGGQGDGNALTQLSGPNGIFVDTLDTLYVAEQGNNRITRWTEGYEKIGTVVVVGNGEGSAGNKFNGPCGLSFDKHGNLYVADSGNHRVQRFIAESKPVHGTASVVKVMPNLPVNTTWEQQGVTVAGGHGKGGNNNQLYYPWGLFVDDDDDQTIVITDEFNSRIMQWKRGDTQGQVVAGGNGEGNRLDQLNGPTDVLIDKETNSLIIADRENSRVVRWSRRSVTTQGKTLIENINCWGLAMDERRNLYVSETEKNEVRRYEIDRGDKKGTVVAGGNGQGDGLNQLNWPTYLFVDRHQSLYVSDSGNHRIMKWDTGAAEGVVVAGGQGKGSALTQLSYPNGIFVDTLGTLYVAEGADMWGDGNHRVTRWSQGSEKKGTVVLRRNGKGSAANQFNCPEGLSFDKHGNLYVVDQWNHRVQRFNIIK